MHFYDILTGPPQGPPEAKESGATYLPNTAPTTSTLRSGRNLGSVRSCPVGDPAAHVHIYRVRVLLAMQRHDINSLFKVGLLETRFFETGN